MRFNWANLSNNIIKLWESIFTEKRSFFKNLMVALAIAFTAFALIYSIYNYTKFYFPPLVQIAVMLIVSYSGFFIGLSFAVLLSITADYFFNHSLGIANDPFAGVLHLSIIILIVFFAAIVTSTIKAAFQKVAVAKKEAEEASGMMEKVLALVVHDIRNPLTSIKMEAQLILKTPGQLEKHQALLQRMIKAVDRTDIIIKSLLDIATIRAGKNISLLFQYCDLNNEIVQIVEAMPPNLSANISYISSGPVWGNWGLDGITRALENLITNAIKYGEPNSPIVIKLQSNGPEVFLSVHNEGREIALEDRAKLFEIFQRTHDSETGTIKGWGLGLAIVKAVAEAHHGTVQLESYKEKGSTFTLKLPIRS